VHEQIKIIATEIVRMSAPEAILRRLRRFILSVRGKTCARAPASRLCAAARAAINDTAKQM
jgi:hypothetical protein